MKSIKIFMMAVLLLTGFSRCSKMERLTFIDEAAPAPQQVKDVQVTSTPGGAILTYHLPNDGNLLYVKAVYEIQAGVVKEAKSSFYRDTIELVGYGDTQPHEVKLFSVGKNEKESEPVSISITPLEPPVNTVAASLEVTPTFGGVNVRFKNETQANIVIMVMVDSSGMGTWAPLRNFYTGAREGNFAARGLPALEKKFGIYIMDRWNNKSDTLVTSLIPLQETLIPKTGFKTVRLPGDGVEQVNPPLLISKMWDEKLEYEAYASPRNVATPHWVTFDMGVTAILGRFKMWNVEAHAYKDGGLKRWQFWGTRNPNPSGSFDGWELLGEFNAFKPSGLPDGQRTAEDIDMSSYQGIDYEFPSGVPPVRYLRIVTLENYGGDGLTVVAELSFWGQIQ
jgi:hypothetical protein